MAFFKYNTEMPYLHECSEDEAQFCDIGTLKVATNSGTILRSAEYTEPKVDNPAILSELGDYIANRCTHGFKNPVATEKDGNISYLCCLKCTVEFLFKERTKHKITVR